MNEQNEIVVNAEEGSDRQENAEVLNVGIDLGTSKSAISASNGSKNWLESFVGWPRDFIARKVLGKRILFGKEALENRLSLDISRPLERGVIKDGSELSETAVKELVGHLIGMAKAGHNYKKTRAIIGVPPESFKSNQLAIRQLVADFADAIMVVSEPFSVAYGFNALNNAMVIDIGAGTMDFCIMHGTMPSEDDQKSILTAGDYIDQQLQTYLHERYPKADFTLHMARRFKEEHSFVGHPEKQVMVEIPVEGKPTMHDITAEMRRACESILPGLEETMFNLIAGFDPEFQKKVINNIILAGGGSQIKGLREHIESVLKEYGPCQVQTIADPLFGGADGALGLARDMPDEYWENT
ncbi:MAG: MamK family actin-like protein [Desulfosudaceae bacterium]